MLIEPRQRAVAAIELTGAGHGDERVAAGCKMDVDRQFIPADNATRRVEQVEVAGFLFGIERALYGERPDMAGRVKEGFFRGVTKLQSKRCLPAFDCFIHHLSC